MPGGKSGLFPSLEKQREEWAKKRGEERAKPCPMRGYDGECAPVKRPCLFVEDSICEALHHAYELGRTMEATREQREAGNR